MIAMQKKHMFLRQAGYGKFDTFHRADLRISDIGNLLGSDWIRVAHELDIEDSDINIIKSEYPDNEGQQAMVMLRLWINSAGNRATGNELEKVLRHCGREDIVKKCISTMEVIKDDAEIDRAKIELRKIDDNVSESRSNSYMTTNQSFFLQERVPEVPPQHQERIEQFEERRGDDDVITEKHTFVQETPEGISECLFIRMR